MRMKLRIDSINSRHVHLSVFSDSSFENNGTFALLGKLVMTIGEYQLFRAALGLGSKQTQRHFVLMPEDSKFKEWSEAETLKEVQDES